MDFSKLSEADVREEILAPLIRSLGYSTGSEHNVLREQSLRYPRVSIGRKNEARDPILRGKADYILQAGGRVNWVIEAKAPSSEIGVDDVEQAWTYANHPEVRAVYFVLCNGRQLDVFQTNAGPTVAPVLSMKFHELGQPEKQEVLRNCLSPLAVLRDHPSLVIETRVSLGPGLRSIARVTDGYIRYTRSSVPNRAFSEMQVEIISGAVERDDQNRMIALLETRAPVRTIQALIEKLGLSTFEMVSGESKLATSKEYPNTFVYERSIVFPEGEEMLDMTTWKTVRLPCNVPVSIRATATGFLEGNRFSGEFRNAALMQFLNNKVPVNFEGEFCLFLA